MYFPHETLPDNLSLYIKNEQLRISYLNLEDIFSFLYKKDIGVNKNITFYQARFTIAHETSHYYFGHQNRSYLFGKLFKNYDEKQADDFAIKKLLPKNQLLEEFYYYAGHLTILEKIFGVEMSLIEKRLKQILMLKKNMPNILSVLKFLGWLFTIIISLYSLYQSNKALEYSKSQANSSETQVEITKTQLIEEKNKLKVETINNIRDDLTSTTLFPEVSNSLFNYYDSKFNKNDFVIFSRKLEMITTAYNGNIINEEDIKENFYSEIDFICRNFTVATSSLYNKKIQTLCNIIY